MEQGQDEVVLEIIKFVKEHQGLLFNIMAHGGRSVRLSDLEEIHLVTSILSKVYDPFPTVALVFKRVLLNLDVAFTDSFEN